MLLWLQLARRAPDDTQRAQLMRMGGIILRVIIGEQGQHLLQIFVVFSATL